MNISYFKTILTSTLLAGAFALSAKAAAPVSVIPAEAEQQESLQDFQLVFAEGAVPEWTVTGTENTPKLYKDGAVEPVGLAGPSMLSADGNILKVSWPDEFTKAGKYELEIPQGAYAVNNEAGEACKYAWDVTGVKIGYTVSPDVNVVSEIQNIRITFNDATSVEMGNEWGTTFGATLYIVNDSVDKAENRRGTFMPQFNGNNVDLTMYSPIIEPGEYVVEIPAGAFKLDGTLYEEPITLNYTIAEPTYPDVELSVNPAASIVDEIGTIEITFGGVELVQWQVTGTENAPYLEDANGNRMATFSKLGGLDNMLSLGMYSDPFDVKGEYTVVIPEGSYVFQGIYHGLAGKEIRLNYQILGQTGFSVEPSTNVVSEIQNIRITFHEATTVEMGNEWGTTFGATLYIVNDSVDKAENRRGTFMPQFNGNNVDLTMYSPIIEPGEYVVEIPAGAFKLDGNLYEEPITLNYTIAEPTYPEVDLSVNPAASIVDEIGTIEITFGGVELVQWQVTGTENAPYIEDVNGTRMATFSKLGGLDNMLSLGMYSDPFDVKGEYTVVIPEGSYVFQGIYHGLAGKEIRLNYQILGQTGITVEPSTDVVSEIQNIRITFNEATLVEMGNEWSTTFGATLYIVNDSIDKAECRRGTFMPQFHGNNVDLTMNSPIIEPGDYVVEIPAGAFMLDSVLYEQPINLNFTIAEPAYPEVELSVNPDASIVDEIGTIEITFGGVDLVEWQVTGTENAPYIEDVNGNRMATFSKLGGLDNMLSLGMYSDPFNVKGEYTVVIPEGSYVFQGIYHGLAGKEIRLNYEILGQTGITVEPSTDVLTEIQNIRITFNEATTVEMGNEWSTTFGATLYLDNTGDNVPVSNVRSWSLTNGKANADEVTDCEYWTASSNGRYALAVGLEDQVLPSNTGGALTGLDGLYFTVAKGAVYGITKNFCFQNAKMTVRIPNCKANDEIMVDFSGAGAEAIVTSDNIADTLIVASSISKQCEESKVITRVKEDGDVVLNMSCSKGFRLYGITVTTYASKAECRRGTFMPQFHGNTVDLTMNSPIFEPGNYIVEIPAGAFKLDGNLYEEPITLNYTITEPTYPEVELTVNPEASIVDEIGTIEITFGGVDIVEWQVTGTENAPYIEDANGNRVATFAKLGGLDNMLSLGMYSDPFNVKGEYTVVIPEGSYVFQGIYHGLAGKEIRLNYEILGQTGISVEPSTDVLTEIQNIRITFHEATTVEMGEEWGTTFGAILYLDNSEAEAPRTWSLTDGKANADEVTDCEYWTASSNGRYALAVGLDNQELPSNTGGALTGLEGLYFTVAKGAVYGITKNFCFQNAKMTVRIPGCKANDEIMVDFSGAGAEAIVTSDNIADTLIVASSISKQCEESKVYTTVKENGDVILNMSCSKGFRLYGITVTSQVDKAANRRGTFMPQFHGNTVDLTMNSPITDPGNYVVEIPAGAFKLDGNLYEEPINLYFTIAEPYDPFQYTVEPAEGTVDALNSFTITFTEATTAAWNMDAIMNDRSLCPTIKSGEALNENLINLTESGNVLIAGPYDTTYEWTEAGQYVITIPAGSYTLDGEAGEEIVLNYIVSGTSGLDLIFSDSTTVDVYDLKGRVIMRDADASALKQVRGIFIVNGKKYILR